MRILSTPASSSQVRKTKPSHPCSLSVPFPLRPGASGSSCILSPSAAANAVLCSPLVLMKYMGKAEFATAGRTKGEDSSGGVSFTARSRRGFGLGLSQPLPQQQGRCQPGAGLRLCLYRSPTFSCPSFLHCQLSSLSPQRRCSSPGDCSSLGRAFPPGAHPTLVFLYFPEENNRTIHCSSLQH